MLTVLDSLDLLCLQAMLRWEGCSSMLGGGDVGSLGSLVLSKDEQEALTYRRAGDLEWSELVVPVMVSHILEVVGDVWAIDALRYVAETLALRETKVAVRTRDMSKGGVAMTDTSVSWQELLLGGFPSVEGLRGSKL